ncbi:MAG TPA: fumarylacetoacetate hydrolase family protein [Stellaceae bacterium]|nr:fumarylacetoacetate hydrolase family protein [Stellaceae bacterium]
MDKREIDDAVIEFAAAQERGEYFPQAWAGRLLLDDAYRIQLALLRRRDAGARRIGWKVGLTAAAIQQQFGVHEPVFGCLLADGLRRSGEVFSHAALIRPGFENELCIVLGRDLPPDATPTQVAAAIDRVYPAFEIIETRGDFTGELALALADNAQQKAFVLGEPVAADRLPDLAAVEVRVRINDTAVATAAGEAVLGHPCNAVAWLAAKLTAFGETVRAGDYIMSGSFTRQFALGPGDRIAADFAGIGSVSASFV